MLPAHDVGGHKLAAIGTVVFGGGAGCPLYQLRLGRSGTRAGIC